MLIALAGGWYSYDELMEMVEDFDQRFERLYLESSLPHSPDHKRVQALYLEILYSYYQLDS
jgi:hypothetical protein